MSNEIPFKSGQLEEMFNNNIAEYGYKHKVKSIEGNENQEGQEETYRTELRRQRDKILYTGGFRRLQDKTQVMAATLSGDHRTRLTHTLEVEQISISIANALQLNTDLVSAISLGHDIGHTPFGHAAERKLNELLKGDGGFHHPIQSVKYLWEKYGTKIDNEIYNGILFHDSDMFAIKKEDALKQLGYMENNKDISFSDSFNKLPTTLEAQVVVWADKIAYITHDLEDFLRSSIYTNLKKNYEDIEGRLCEVLNKLIKKELSNIEEFKSRDLIRNIIDELINQSSENIKSSIISKTSKKKTISKKKIISKKKTISKEKIILKEKILLKKVTIINRTLKKKNIQELTQERFKNNATSEKKKYLNSLIINFSDGYRENYYRLRKFLDDYYIFSPEVQRSDAKAQIIVESLFNSFKGNYKLLPLSIRDDIDKAIKFEIKELNNKLTDKLKELEKQEIFKIEDLEKSLNDDQNKGYKKLKESIISRKVASYIATMTDSYAESMYCNLIGSRPEIFL